MEYTILPNGKLRLTADQYERAQLAEVKREREGFDHSAEVDALDSLIANSELQWIPEGTTSDLTSAPMLGILGEAEAGGNGPLGAVLMGRWPDKAGVVQGYFAPVLSRWCYMSYQVRSFCDDLLEKGECIWDGGAADAS